MSGGVPPASEFKGLKDGGPGHGWVRGSGGGGKDGAPQPVIGEGGPGGPCINGPNGPCTGEGPLTPRPLEEAVLPFLRW